MNERPEHKKQSRAPERSDKAKQRDEVKQKRERLFDALADEEPHICRSID